MEVFHFNEVQLWVFSPMIAPVEVNNSVSKMGYSIGCVNKVILRPLISLLCSIQGRRTFLHGSFDIIFFL